MKLLRFKLIVPILELKPSGSIEKKTVAKKLIVPILELKHYLKTLFL